MKRQSMLLLTSLALTLFLVGCANPGIVKLSPDTYMLSRTDKGGVFGNASAMKADVISEANEFAEKQGKVAIVLSLKEDPMYIGHFASVEYQFRVVDKNDPEARRVNLTPRPNLVIENTSSNVNSKDHKDVYAELIKLDDLRNKGILSQDEFDAQKKKLLSGN